MPELRKGLYATTVASAAFPGRICVNTRAAIAREAEATVAAERVSPRPRKEREAGDCDIGER